MNCPFWFKVLLKNKTIHVNWSKKEKKKVWLPVFWNKIKTHRRLKGIQYTIQSHNTKHVHNFRGKNKQKIKQQIIHWQAMIGIKCDLVSSWWTFWEKNEIVICCQICSLMKMVYPKIVYCLLKISVLFNLLCVLILLISI